MTDWILNHLVLFVIRSMYGRIHLTVLKWSFEASKHLSEQVIENGKEQTDKDESIHSGRPLIVHNPMRPIISCQDDPRLVMV